MIDGMIVGKVAGAVPERVGIPERVEEATSEVKVASTSVLVAGEVALTEVVAVVGSTTADEALLPPGT